MWNWKKTSVVLLSLLLVISMQFWIGCEEEEDEVLSAFGDLDSASQIEIAYAIVNQSTALFTLVDELAITAESGDFEGVDAYLPFSFSPAADVKIREIDTPPDTTWTGPDGDGWYSSESSFSTVGYSLDMGFQIRWTPDIWNDEYANEETTGMDFIESITMVNGTMTYTMDAKTALEISTDRTMVSGSAESENGYSETDVGWMSMLAHAVLSDVAVAGDDYSAVYSGDAVMSAEYPDSGSEVEADGEMTFTYEYSINSDGSGTGSIKCENIDIIHVVFNTMSEAGTYEGYFTIILDGFTVQYPFPVDEE